MKVWAHDFGRQGIRESSQARGELSTQPCLASLHGSSLTQGTPLDHLRAGPLLDKHPLIYPREGQGSGMICLQEHTVSDRATAQVS